MKRRLDNDRYQIFAILVHVLGVERNASGERWCSLCINGEGPFEGCWTLPRAAAWELHQYAMCCANCLFVHKKSNCSVKASWEARCDKRPGEKTFTGTPPPVTEWAASAATANGNSQARKRQLSPPDANEESLSQRRRQERNTGSDDEEQTGAGRRIVTLPLPLSRRTTRATNARTRRQTSPEPSPEPNIFSNSTSSSAVVMAGQQPSDELLEMEDWEIAPGRIREDGAAQPSSKSLPLPTHQPISALRAPRVHSRPRFTPNGLLMMSLQTQSKHSADPHFRHRVFQVVPGEQPEYPGSCRRLFPG